MCTQTLQFSTTQSELPVLNVVSNTKTADKEKTHTHHLKISEVPRQTPVNTRHPMDFWFSLSN